LDVPGLKFPQLILCDAAQADPLTGKVHMLGAGWSMTGTPTQHAVVLLIKVPWDRANQQIPFALELRHADGPPMELDTEQGKQPARFEGQLEVGRPPGVAPGSMLDASFALNVPPLPLPAGRYQWHVDIAQQELATSFTVRRQPG
jgi:hypothetical protein